VKNAATTLTSADSGDLHAQTARQQYRLLTIGLVALLALACAFPFTLNLSDPDLWGHIRYGQDWLASGRMPRTATHTYTAVGHPWINHENAAELLFAVSYEQIGIYGMLAAKCLLGMCILAVMASLASIKCVPAISTWALLLLVSTNLQAFFPMRPQLLSFALCAMALTCLDRAFPSWPERREIRLRWLAPLPLVFAAWVNSHGGFVAGLGIVGVLLLGRIVELALRDGRRAVGDMIWLAAVGLACLGATLVNPYGLDMHLWLWHAWGGAPPEITEWAPPLPGKPVFWPFVALIGTSIACLIATKRSRDWAQIVVLALVAWQGSLHLRHIAFAALLIGFWLPVHWHSALLRLRPDRGRLPIVLPPRWLRLSMAGAIALGIVLESVTLAGRLSDLPVLRSQYPVDAVQFMADNRIRGKAAVAFNWSQYVIAALAPEVTVGFDGRFDTCYPQEAIDIHFDFLMGNSGRRDRRPDAGPIDGRRVLEYGRPDLVLVERRFKASTAIMQAEASRRSPEWVLLYRDKVAELWGRTERFDDPSSPRYLALERRSIDAPQLETAVQWPALPTRNRSPEAQPQRDPAQLTEL
jgi:hypothetical protein